ncbi:hypothetical protein EVAR_83587_1 [Eumeta japonica]|uniref:Uncharacterized protein n=1 Tax=Eumeta variegata TaxID=151549 RepID=A0A4C1UNC0_EUMVA|nr:hypothetical protein EVAR_83587_1 [Eumeta japonica]
MRFLNFGRHTKRIRRFSKQSSTKRVNIASASVYACVCLCRLAYGDSVCTVARVELGSLHFFVGLFSNTGDSSFVCSGRQHRSRHSLTPISAREDRQLACVPRAPCGSLRPITVAGAARAPFAGRCRFTAPHKFLVH